LLALLLEGGDEARLLRTSATSSTRLAPACSFRGAALTLVRLE
jgi:hypothetical protein